MSAIPSPEAISNLLTRIDQVPADQLESETLDFKRWLDAKKSLAEAVKMAVCFANAGGGVVVFGVKDDIRGRQRAITGCSRYDLDTWRRGIYEGTMPNLTVDVSELTEPEGTLILVRVPKGPAPALRHFRRPLPDPGGKKLHALFTRGVSTSPGRAWGIGLECRAG